MAEFYSDAAAGTLPNFAFIEPRIAAAKVLFALCGYHI